MKDNIILIGMPGAGKSTVGVVLAKKLGYGFVDSDLVIQEKYGRLLHELIEENGVEGFWKIENEVNCSLERKRCVIATGGSVVYGSPAMEHLRKMGTVIYLQLPCEEIAERLGDLNARGVTLRPGQTLEDLYRERVPLYEKYAHLTVSCSGKALREIVGEIAGLAARGAGRAASEKAVSGKASSEKSVSGKSVSGKAASENVETTGNRDTAGNSKTGLNGGRP